MAATVDDVTPADDPEGLVERWGIEGDLDDASVFLAHDGDRG